MPVDIAKYKDEFISEAREIIEVLNSNLLLFEKDLSNTNIKKDIYRSLHTIKGMAATMGLQDISSVCHEVENLIGRDKVKVVSPEAVSAVFESIDILDLLLKSYKEDKKETIDIAPVITKLQSMEKEQPEKIEQVPSNIVEQDKSASARTVSLDVNTIRVDKEFLDETINMAGEISINVEQLNNIISKFNSAELFEIVESVRILSGSLREKTLKLRIVPVDTVFDRFPRRKKR